MTCRHPIRHRWVANYRDAGRIDCLRCGGVVPLGPASDTPAVELEIWAAEVAAWMGDEERTDDHGPFDDGARQPTGFWAGFTGHRSKVWLDPPCADRYAAGALAGTIRRHDMKGGR